jgi:hypothetical protein
MDSRLHAGDVPKKRYEIFKVPAGMPRAVKYAPREVVAVYGTAGGERIPRL